MRIFLLLSLNSIILIFLYCFLSLVIPSLFSLASQFIYYNVLFQQSAYSMETVGYPAKTFFSKSKVKCRHIRFCKR